MERTCDGTDPFVVDESGNPCRCGKQFDDVRYMTVWPHQYIPTKRERVFRLIENRDVVLTALSEARPGTDWEEWLYEQAAEVGLTDALPARAVGPIEAGQAVYRVGPGEVGSAATADRLVVPGEVVSDR